MTNADAIAQQRRIALGIRDEMKLSPQTAETIARVLKSGRGRPVSWFVSPYAVLAAMVTDDALWDAAAQVRQVVVLERVEHRESERGRARVSALAILLVLCFVFWAAIVGIVAAVQP